MTGANLPAEDWVWDLRRAEVKETMKLLPFSRLWQFLNIQT
jgi:hypothetical protein